MISKSPSAKPNRATIDLSNEALARHWSKRLRKSKAEIQAAIAKVGNNAATVRKELEVEQE
jgi:Protein of unknown function (DUF3606)